MAGPGLDLEILLKCLADSATAQLGGSHPHLCVLTQAMGPISLAGGSIQGPGLDTGGS